MIWILLIYLAVSSAQNEVTRETKNLKAETEQQTISKSKVLSTVFRELYVVTRTISLLPAIRKVDPQNRSTAEDDVIDGKRFDIDDAKTVQQLYNHAASIASVSEIYVVYDGFRPDLGQVPFIMFDDVIVDRIHNAHMKNKKSGNASDPTDIPIEDESEEYAYLQRLLDHFRKKYPRLPPTAPDGIGVDISPVMITCDNSQFLSIRNGNQQNRLGVLISVPIFDDDDGTFKGLISTIVRTNVFEAHLVNWPFIPTSDSERRKLSLDGVDLNGPVSNYLLEDKATGIYIFDRRNSLIPQYINGSLLSMIDFSQPVTFDGKHKWTLHQFIPNTKILAIKNEIYQALIYRIINITILLLVIIGGIWLFLQRRITTEMETLASIDSLTDLPNRRILAKKITHSLITAQKNQQQSALVMVDLDNFKLVNDSIGHAAGDQLLKEVGRRFKDILRSTDVVEHLSRSEIQGDFAPIVGRLGGDEFLIILPNVGYMNQAVLVTERLMAELSKPIEVEGYSTYIHASMGIALYPIHGDNADILLRRADNAMYAAKSKNGNSMAVYNEELNYASTRHLELMSDLHVALANEQFVLKYRPLLEVASNEIHLVEVVRCWQHPRLGWITPNEFIPLLEQSGLIVKVGKWVLRNSCRQLKHWKQAGSPIERISVNVSMIQLTQSDFATSAIEILNDEGISPESVMIEITESVVMEDPGTLLQQLNKLREIGIQIVLNDIGTGNSSLIHLLRLPVDALKIDYSLLNQIESELGKSAVISLCDLTRLMKIEFIAEGVETADECRMLIEAGCQYIQGSIISRALPPEQVDRLLQSFDAESVFSEEDRSSTLITSN